jgi:hypothetical protein
MDEVGFNLSDCRQVARVGPIDGSSKTKSRYPADVHITCVATISIEDDPVPRISSIQVGIYGRIGLDTRILHPSCASQCQTAVGPIHT